MWFLGPLVVIHLLTLPCAPLVRPFAALRFPLCSRLPAVYLHTLPALCGQLGLDAPALGLTAVTPQHMAASVAVLAAPGCIAWAADALSRAASPATGRPLLQELYSAVGRGVGAALAAVRSNGGGANGGGAVPAAAGVAGNSVLGAVQQQQEQQQGAGAEVPMAPAPFLYLAYGYVPLVWAGTLAHYLAPLLGEAGRLLPVGARVRPRGAKGTPLAAGWAFGLDWLLIRTYTPYTRCLVSNHTGEMSRRASRPSHAYIVA